MQTIISREYKMMLSAARFAGDEEKMNEAARALWGDLAALILPHAIAVSGTEDIDRKRREVRFLDTGEKWLRTNDYAFRERIDREAGERQLTLKFRHPDRFVSQDRDMKPGGDRDPDLKFEEDIKPPFQSLFSFSSNVLVDDEVQLATLKDVAKLYPGLPKAVGEFPEDEALRQVGGLTAFERVVKGTSFQIRKKPEVSAGCSLTLWYDEESGEKPLVAEFSFKYGDPDAAYSGKMADRAYRAFVAMQQGLQDWIDADSLTKTAYVYSLEDR
jgi:hypothetical protein